jgi:hypothetical protein
VGAGIAVLCSIPALIGAIPAHGTTRDPAALRDRILTTDTPYAGYAESVGSLGLPDLPAVGDVGELLGGRTRLRSWHASATSWRVDLLSDSGERDGYATRIGTATWDYERNLRTDLVGYPTLRLPRPSDLLPPELARRLLGGARGAERLEPLKARRVAGIDAVGLRLIPTDPDTTVGHIDVWADRATALPVYVAVTGRAGGAPSVSTGFLDLRQGASAVPSGVLTAPAPRDASYVDLDAPQVSAAIDHAVRRPLPAELAGRTSTPLVAGQPRALRTYGTGFDTFAALALPGQFSQQAYDAAKAAGGIRHDLDGQPVVVLRTSLLTLVVVAPGPNGVGLLLAGSVEEKVLLQAATDVANTVFEE